MGGLCLGEVITNLIDICPEVLRGRVLLRLQSISLCLMGVSADDMYFRRYVLLLELDGLLGYEIDASASRA